ncbi:MAG: hypothetical protein FWD98_06100 [Defluviitaleaceae bacterium]|nr:hypothetical protein [Defluviitaleaceae bacterium]
MKIFVNEYDAASLEKAESLLFNGNGHIGVRGNLEEAYYNHFATNRETYINGFYETKPIVYPEKCHGFTERGEEMIGVADGQTTEILIGGEQFRLDTGQICFYERYLDMLTGQTVRTVEWLSPKGRRTGVTIARMACFTHKNIFAMRYTFEKIGHDEDIELSTHINFQPTRTIDTQDPRMSHCLLTPRIDSTGGDTIRFSTRRSGMTASCRWRLSEPGAVQTSAERLTIRSKLNGTVFEKVFSYAFREQGHGGFELSFGELANLQRGYLSEFWQGAKISITEAPGLNLGLEEAVNFGAYALLSSIGTNGASSIAAKGLSGSGYEGHVFWDAEAHVFPVMLYMAPRVARQMLVFRINTLEGARRNAALMGYPRGVLYPWRTISGSECSAFFEAGSAQHHINADIARAFALYYEATKDTELFFEGGFEVMLETARLFKHIGYMRDGGFHIDMVTGPDEYTALVCDNYYTNVMVKHNFMWVHKMAHMLARYDETRYQALARRLGLDGGELEHMAEAAQRMAKPFCADRNIVAQDRDFLNKPLWPRPFGEEPGPLLLHYHPLIIYRHQVCKQADAVLALCLFPEEEDADVVKSSVEYYDTVTTHDSSLSFSAFSTVYSRLGNTAKSFEYFLKNARCDLDNLHKNTKDGLHIAAMGGTIANVQHGFCGLRVDGDGFSLNPHLPAEIVSVKFSIHYNGEVHRLSCSR